MIQNSVRKIIWKLYEKNPFAVLGPDNYASLRGVHQSPIGKKPPGKRRVEITILLNQLMLWLYPVVYPVMKTYFRRLESSIQGQDYGTYQENVCLMGACMVYSKDYMDVRNKIFEPETKFYYEEYIQTVWCLTNNRKIVYNPDIVVYHMEGKATGTVNKQEKKRIRFRIYNTLLAARVYREFVSSEV